MESEQVGVLPGERRGELLDGGGTARARELFQFPGQSSVMVDDNVVLLLLVQPMV